MKKVNDENFKEEVLEADDLVLVDFWASWCGPCKMLAPVLDNFDEEMKAEPLKVVKLSVEENEEIPSEYGVEGIPTLMLFKDGEVIDKTVGAKSLEELEEFVNNHLE